VGIAVEGLAPADQSTAASETVEIADLTLYYGEKPTFEGADNVKIIQFKYSISHKDDDFRASDANKTFVKFAAAYLDHKERYGAKAVRDKLHFELITNRAIFPPLEEAITCIANQRPLSGESKKQAHQLAAACGLKGKLLIEFVGSLQMRGFAGTLGDNKGDLSQTVVDWSAATDALARARLGSLKQLVRDKAGSAGANQNVITKVDLLAALDIADVDELLPCPTSLPIVGKVVERAQLAEASALVPALNKPLLVHAAGGIGKTVFLESLAGALSAEHEVIFFDCFGGGSYRSPEDSRHLPKRGLIHIVNTLACRGLCDPLLPGNDSVDSLMRTFRRRLTQCVTTLSTASPSRQLIIFIDAIDNAADHAKDKSEPAFPTLILESFHHGGHVEGVRLVVSCRSHRIERAINGIPYQDFELKSFNIQETETYLRDRLSRVTQTEIQVAQARSEGNARILEHLVTSDRGLLDQSEIANTIALPKLLSDRLQNALVEAVSRGYKKEDINAFLAGLSVLPPPVPIDEYAGAHGFDISAIESFAADLAPLLERTNHGLMFRDEPTETLIRETYGSNDNALRRVAKNLQQRQGRSIYAARALPGLLQKLDDGKLLFKLAFNNKFPETITGTLGKQKIRYARLKAAVLHAATKSDYNNLVHLLVELSTIAAVDQRGASYILDFPDLVIAAKDIDAIRRLFETRTSWPGTRHARLTIANTLSGDFESASRHAISADEWIAHFVRQDRTRQVNQAGPEMLDIAAIPYFLITQKRGQDAMRYTRRWKNWASYEAGELLFGLLQQTTSLTAIDLKKNVKGFLDSAGIKDVGIVVAALTFLELDGLEQAELIRKLGNSKNKVETLEINDRFRSNGPLFLLQDGLLKVCQMAGSLGLRKEALAILKLAPHQIPGVWAFQDRFSNHQVGEHLVYASLSAFMKGKKLSELDVLPKELYEIGSSLKNISGELYKKKLKEKLEQIPVTKDGQKEDLGKSISYDLKRNLEDYISGRLSPVFELAIAFAETLGATSKSGDVSFLNLLDTWAKAKTISGGYYANEHNRFLQMLGAQLAEFSLWACPDLKETSVRRFLEQLQQQEILSTTTQIKVIAILSSREYLHALAGELAMKVASRIDSENDVTYKALEFAQLARAILPASQDEATAYFRKGLEQMDAIGSGDYQFTSELLLFASSLKGDELPDKEIHTLTNICELNMPDEEEKFPWFDFAKGLSRTSGLRTLAKLARWDDRSKVSLAYTLLPYLTALVDEGKIEPEVALTLNQLADPVELHVCNTASFANAIDQKDYPNKKELIAELIEQYEANNPGVSSSSTLGILASISEKAYDGQPNPYSYLSRTQERYAKVRDELNEQMNYHPGSTRPLSKEWELEKKQNRAKLRKLAASTNPLDESSIAAAVDEINTLKIFHDFKDEFFEALRFKVPFSSRSQYICIIAEQENLYIYTKLDELKKCKTEWRASSVSLAPTYKRLGALIIDLHSENFIGFNQLSTQTLNELSNISEVAESTLALELLKKFAATESSTPASVWLGLASFICNEAAEGQGQKALTRLLNSNAAKLASTVVDGKWKPQLYPSNDSLEIVSGLVWRMLGSPYASDRWRAAHSIRCFAKFGRWDFIDVLVKKFPATNAHPFQAPELPFYYLHARLWLLIAVARISIDDPRNVSRYHHTLTSIALNEISPHVLIRQFAAQALLQCVSSGSLKLSKKMLNKLRTINVSPFPQLRQRSRRGGHGSYYAGRPKDVAKPKDTFQLDYDFQKYHIHGLGNVFGKPAWEIGDLITEVVRGLDTTVDGMYTSGGRERHSRNSSSGMTSEYHNYGQQLGWHALFIVAAKLLAEFPVTDDSYDEDPWEDFLGDWLLTRNDGLWLSDGVQKPPLEAKINLLEKNDEGFVITGAEEKILSLLGFASKFPQELVIHADWHSPDNIEVAVRSAMVAPTKAKSVVKGLIDEQPFFAWIPTFDEFDYHRDHLENDKRNLFPWIIKSSIESKLDDDDPLACIYSASRPYFVQVITKSFGLTTKDPYKQTWINSFGQRMAQSEVWGHKLDASNEASYLGSRLLCSQKLLYEVLNTTNTNLLLMIKLQRYEKSSYLRKDSQFSHTIAVLLVKKNLTTKLYMGAVNKVHVDKY